jgi:hypothetical protein
MPMRRAPHPNLVPMRPISTAPLVSLSTTAPGWSFEGGQHVFDRTFGWTTTRWVAI